MLKSALLTLLFTTCFFSIYSQSKTIQSFGVSEGYERLYFDGAYHLKHIETGEVKSFYEFAYVSNVENDHVVYKSKDGYYGIMDQRFETVLSPDWVEIKDFGFGYFALGHFSGETKWEDRGSGTKEYPLLTWKIFSINEDRFVSDMELVHPICIYGEVLAETVDQQKIKIALGKINFGYTDPMMKALSYQSDQEGSSGVPQRTVTSPKTR